MAINPGTQYVGKIDTTDPNYPYGKSQNITVPSDGTGTPWESALINDIFGYQQALLNAAGIVPSGTPDNIATSQYLEAHKKVTLLSEYEPGSGPNISLSGYLDRQGIWAEDETGIQDANDYIVALGKRDVIKLPPRSVIPITGALLLDVSFVSLEGNGSELDASGMASGVVINMVGSEAPPYYQNGTEFKNFVITGPGIGSSVVGMFFDNSWPSGAGPSHISLRDLRLQSLSTGEKYGGNVHQVKAYGCDIQDCAIAVQVTNAANGGRDLMRIGGSIFDNTSALLMQNPDGQLQLFGTSLINNGSVVLLSAGHVMLHGCNIVAEDYIGTPFIISGDGAGVDMVGGSLELTNAAAKSFSYWVNAGAGSFFRSRGARLVNINTLSDEFATGDGVVMVRDAQYPEIWGGLGHEGCHVLHSDRSMLVDGGFEEATILDDIFITQDSKPIDDRFTGDGVILTISSAYATVALGQSLKYDQGIHIVGGDSAFALVSLPVTPFNRIDGRFFYRSPVNVASTLRFRYSFAKVGNTVNGVPSILHKEEIRNEIVGLTGADTGWQEVTLNTASDPDPFIAPEWATHFVIEVDGTDADADVYFDDLNVNILG